MSTSPSPRDLEHRRHPSAPPVGHRGTVLAQWSLDGFDPHAHQWTAREVHLGVAAQPAPHRESRRHLGEVAHDLGDVLDRSHADHSHEVVDVVEVRVEGAARHLGGPNDIVDPKSPVAPIGDQVVGDPEDGSEGPLARTGSVGFEVAGSVEDRPCLGAEAQDRCLRAGRAGVDVHAGQRAEQRSVHDVGEGGVDPFAAIVLGCGGAEDRHAAERADHAGVEELDGRVEQPRGKIGRRRPGLRRRPTARWVMEAAPPAKERSVSAAASNARMIGS